MGNENRTKRSNNNKKLFDNSSINEKQTPIDGNAAKFKMKTKQK